MNNDEIRNKLQEIVAEDYKIFSKRLIPGCDKILGVRLPKLREMAKKLAAGEWKEYLDNASDELFEEKMLQCMTIGYVKGDIKEILLYAERIIPKIDNWSLNDSFCSSFKIAGKYREEVYDFLIKYINSDKEYEQRVVTIMLMDYFLVDDYINEVLSIYNNMNCKGYYSEMGVAWGIATAFAKYPEKTMDFLLSDNNKLNDWVYNKAIQKMLESYRVSNDYKEILRKMKKKNEK